MNIGLNITSITDLKFPLIVLCFVVALGSYFLCHSKKDWAYLATAMGLTMVSDFFLVVRHSYTIGVFVFCFVHMAYILRVGGCAKRIVTTVLCGLPILFLTIIFSVDTIFYFAAVYAALFIQNLILHYRYRRQNGPNSRIMLYGLVLFALCDICVLLYNLPRFVPPLANIALIQDIADRTGIWIWIFYAPSQVLLSISVVRGKLMSCGSNCNCE